MVEAASLTAVTRYVDMNRRYQLFVLEGVKERLLGEEVLFSFSSSLRSFD